MRLWHDIDFLMMYSDRTLINRRNVVNDPKNAYAANRDFLILEVKARVIAAAMEVLGFESNSGTPTKNENIFIKLQAK